MARVEAYLRAKFHLDPSNRLATIHQRHRQTGQTDRQLSYRIGERFYKRSPNKYTFGDIFATKACTDNRKNLLSSNISSTCPHNMVNFGPLAAEIVSLVWGNPANFNGFRVCQVEASQRRDVCETQCSDNFNQAESEHKTLAGISRSRHVAIAAKPVHQVQIRPIVHNWRAPFTIPKLHPGPCSSVGMR